MNAQAGAETRSTCPYCGVGCGVVAQVVGDAVSVRGDEHHPANAGQLCVKGTALAETLGHEGRLLHPEVEGRRASWDAALDHVADGFARIIDVYGPQAVAFYVSGQLLTEDYYVANKLMKGYIGSANIDTNSRLCMSSAVMGYKRAFGGDLVPNSYQDLDQADLVVLAGSNTAWCHPIVYQRIRAARAQRPGMKVVVIDPRRTASCDIADLHLPLAPGSDVLLYNGLLSWLAAHGDIDEAFVRHATNHGDVAIATARRTAPDTATVAAGCALREADVRAFYQLFADTPRTVTLFSQGINQSSQGTDKVNAIINCHLLTGRVGRAGAGPFSITGQPNAMGGREVGGLSTLLAAHMNLADADDRARVQRFWASPRMADSPGLKAVELFDAIAAGEVRAVWIMATNPVVSMPAADRVRDALAQCELVVVSDVMADTDTVSLAQVKLPALAWGEKSGTVTNSERRISRQRAFLPAPGEAKADWWIISEVARRMGFSGFDYDGPAAIFDEHARLSAQDNNGTRLFDIGGLAGLDEQGYDALAPLQWPLRQSGDQGTVRLFTDRRFATSDGRANFVAVEPRAPANAPDEAYPLVLNTGRVRDQWHTMTRTGKAPTLADHSPEPVVQMRQQTGMRHGLVDGALARVESRCGALVARVQFTTALPPDQLFVPIHWNDATASDARVGALVNAVVDPISGEPEFKHTPVRLEPFLVDWYGFALTQKPVSTRGLAWWVRVQGRGLSRLEFAGRAPVRNWERWGRELLGATESSDLLEYCDAATGLYRMALIENERIVSCVFVSPRPELPSRQWLSSLFAASALTPADRAGLLSGRPLDAAADAGPTVCACHGVGRRSIERAIALHELATVEAIGRSTRAGTNCGSCVPELAALLSGAAAAA